MGGKLKLHVVWMTSKLIFRLERAPTTRSDIRLLLLLFSRLVVELCIAWNKQGYRWCTKLLCIGIRHQQPQGRTYPYPRQVNLNVRNSSVR